MKKDEQRVNHGGYFGPDDTEDPWEEDLVISEDGYEVWEAAFQAGAEKASDEGFEIEDY